MGGAGCDHLREQPRGVGQAHDDAACRPGIDEDARARLHKATPELVRSRPVLLLCSRSYPHSRPSWGSARDRVGVYTVWAVSLLAA